MPESHADIESTLDRLIAMAPDRVALAVEMMRVAALSTYENQPISTGVLLLCTDEDPVGQYPAAERDALHYTGALNSIKSFYRLADGLRTVFLVNKNFRINRNFGI